VNGALTYIGVCEWCFNVSDVLVVHVDRCGNMLHHFPGSHVIWSVKIFCCSPGENFEYAELVFKKIGGM